MPDVYIVLDGARVAGVSARLQGAELIRVDEARRMVTSTELADVSRNATISSWGFFTPEAREKFLYDHMRIETHEVQDSDDA